MTVFNLTLDRILLLFMFILAGIVLIKVKALPKSSGEVLSKLENNLLIPCLVFSTFASGFKAEKISSAWRIFLFGSAICGIMMLFAWFIVPLITKDKFTRNIYTYGLVFSNFGFMGNAIVSAVFPDIFLEYLMIPRENSRNLIGRFKSFMNPMFVSMILGVLVGMTDISLPSFLSSAVSIAGECMSPVSMILTGVIVASSGVGKVLKHSSIYIMSLIRLLALPAAFMIIFAIYKIPDTYYICSVCALAMPLGLNIMVIPSGYNKDTSLAAGAIIVSHLASAITIPAVFAMISYMIS